MTEQINEQLRSNIAALKTELKISKNHVRVLSEQVPYLLDRNKTLESEAVAATAVTTDKSAEHILKQRDEAIARLKKEKARLADTVNTLIQGDSERKTVVKQQNDLSELRELNERCEALQKKNKELQGDKQEMNNFQQMKANNKTLKSEIAALKRERQEQQNSSTQVTDVSGSIDNQIQQLKMENAELKSQNKALKTNNTGDGTKEDSNQIKQLKAENADLKSKNKALQKDEVKLRVSQEESNHHELTEEIDVLRRKNARLARKNDELNLQMRKMAQQNDPPATPSNAEMRPVMSGNEGCTPW